MTDSSDTDSTAPERRKFRYSFLTGFGLFLQSRPLRMRADGMDEASIKRSRPRFHSQFRAKWLWMARRYRLLYILYILPLLIICFALAVVLYLPWRLIPFLRPDTTAIKEKDHENRLKSRKRRFKHTAHNDRDVFAPISYGPEMLTGLWYGFWLRVYLAYEVFSEVFHTVRRQGLQVAGVVSAGTIAFFQVEMVLHDWTNSAYTQYIQAVTTGGEANQLKTDPTCAYTVGTGIANWGGGFENIVWYTAYHIWLILLCFMLIGEELFNVRMGTFAPQWSRAGAGYTLMFLSLSTLTTSPNWGIKALVRLRYVALQAIFVIGLYNVVRQAISALGCSEDHDLRTSSYRCYRHPLRLWTEEQWADMESLDNFVQRSLKREDGQIDTAHLTWTERVQNVIGDRAWPLKKASMSEEQRTRLEGGLSEKVLGEDEDEDDEMEARVVMPISAKRKNRELGTVRRNIIHAFPKLPPPLTPEQRLMREKYYIAQDYRFDRFKYLTKGHRRRLVPPSIEELHDPTLVKAPYRWEHKTKEFPDRASRDSKRGDAYYGIADWVPVPRDGRKGLYAWYYWFDGRRWAAIACSVAMIIVHVMLMMYNMGFGYSNWPTYIAQYQSASSDWQADQGPSVDNCQYYQGSSLAIWIKLGESSLRGVLATMSWFALWDIFIIHLCLGVFFVALSNNRTWGMHLPWPITLIGPRLSSVSIGWTLGFVGCATLQLGFFDFNTAQLEIARFTGYACIVMWILYLFTGNEPMRECYIRRPFVRWTSAAMLGYLDRKKFRRQLADFDDEPAEPDE